MHLANLQFGSWSYTTEAIRYIVASEEIYLADFFDNQEWLLKSSSLMADEVHYVTRARRACTAQS
jgi:hypothetical protein